MRRLLAAVPVVLLALALLAPAALAHDGGQGLYGETDDKVVTNAGFLVIAFVPVFVGLMSLLQWRLDKRKQARLAAKRSRASSVEWRGGW
jgi:hypothetical protein